MMTSEERQVINCAIAFIRAKSPGPGWTRAREEMHEVRLRAAVKALRKARDRDRDQRAIAREHAASRRLLVLRGGRGE